MSSSNDSIATTKSDCHLCDSISPAGRHGHSPRPPTVSDLLERNRQMRAEIELLEELVRDKRAESLALQRDQLALDQFEVAPASADDRDRRLAFLAEPANLYKLERVIDVVSDLEQFAGEDALSDEVIDEYIRHVERTYVQVLTCGPEAVQTMRSASPDHVRQFLDAKRASEYERVLFVLKESGHYSLILFNAANASLYHYDAAKGNSELAQQMVFRLRRYFEVQQLVEVESRSTSPADCSLCTVDYMMKIIMSAERERGGDVSPVQLLNMPSQPDHLRIIIMSRYIVTKLAQIERLIEDGNSRRWSVNSLSSSGD